jgi:hypothetical protein
LWKEHPLEVFPIVARLLPFLSDPLTSVLRTRYQNNQAKRKKEKASTMKHTNYRIKIFLHTEDSHKNPDDLDDSLTTCLLTQATITAHVSFVVLLQQANVHDQLRFHSSPEIAHLPVTSRQSDRRIRNGRTHALSREKGIREVFVMFRV